MADSKTTATKEPAPEPRDPLLAQLDDPNCIVLVDDGPEGQIVQRWLRKQAPSVIANQRLFHEVDLTMIQASVKVCVVYRLLNQSSHEFYTDKAGVVRSTTRPDEQLFEDIRVSPAVASEDHYSRPNPLAPGRPDPGGMLNAINESMRRNPEESHSFRLDYVDKGEKNPRLLRLRSL